MKALKRISDAPACLNTNDKIMWVTGWNECIEATDAKKSLQNQREETYESLLRAAVGQLKAWANKYGQNGPSWLPPGGDLQLMQTIDDWLATAPAKVTGSQQ